MNLEDEFLDNLVIELEETIGTSPHSREAIKDILQKAADFGKEKEDEERLNGELMKAHLNGVAAGDTITKETLRTEYEKGRYDMREEMLENSTDGYIRRNRYTKTNVLHLDVTCDAVQGFKDNDKLKAIFIKAD